MTTHHLKLLWILPATLLMFCIVSVVGMGEALHWPLSRPNTLESLLDGLYAAAAAMLIVVPIGILAPEAKRFSRMLIAMASLSIVFGFVYFFWVALVASC